MQTSPVQSQIRPARVEPEPSLIPDLLERALAEVRDRAQFWLDTGRPDLALDRNCLHWPLAFPEVFVAPGRSGFDVIVGNPPFLGGKRISGAVGSAYREFLVERIGIARLKSFFRRGSK